MRRRPTTRCGSIGSCARPGTRMSGSSCRRTCGGRWTTFARSPTSSRASASARGSISSRRSWLSRATRRFGRTSCGRSRPFSTAAATSRSRRTTTGSCPKGGGSSPGGASAATSTSSRCCSAWRSHSASASSTRVIGFGSTSPSGSIGTRIPCVACRRIRGSPATSPPTRWGVWCRGGTGARGRKPGLPAVTWAEAEGCRVVDADGREYLDLSGGFGVAALGHRNPKILEAWRAQRVVHALGDLAEAEATVELRKQLPRPAKLGVTGEDGVEIALRTALLATGKPGILAFDGAYHGTGLLALAATGLDRFRRPFAAWLPGPVHRRTYGEDPGPLPADAAVVIVEPVQGRGGSRVPPDEFLPTLRNRCDEA